MGRAFGTAAIVAYFLVWLAAVITVIWVAVHFIHKFW